jgi:DNA/RNA-binding domain of Phe-tRNA-synthetase-like protein
MIESPILVVDPAWSAAHSGASVGVLAFRGVRNPLIHDGLNERAAALEVALRERFGAADRETLRTTPPIPAYAAYYKRWGQRYHVAMQLESVAQKGKDIPRVAALVEAMFLAELGNLLLTAGHDLDALALPIVLDVGDGEPYAAPNGSAMAVKAGDMLVADAAGRVLSAIITGPSGVARIGRQTTAALYYTYAPPGIAPETVSAHLDEIERHVRVISPEAEVAVREVVTA